MDSGGLGDLNVAHAEQFLQGVNFPASKEEAASAAESNGAPQDFISQIRNAAPERFNSPEEVLQAVQGR